MSYTILVGVNVFDNRQYATYREKMLPILSSYGGGFVLDLDVARTHKSPLDGSFNRLFTIEFPSLADKERFYGDPEYIRVRQSYFDSSVDFSTTLLASEGG